MFRYYLEQLWTAFLIILMLWLIFCLLRGMYRDVKKENQRRKNRKLR